MKRGAVIVVAAGLFGLSVRAQQPPVFRTTVDTVVVDVSVRNNGSALTGLTAADFRVTDNGVAQTVESVDARAMPLDVTVVADVSTGTRGVWTGVASAADNIRHVNEDIKTISGVLRPDDRLRLLVSDTSVQQIVPMQSPATATVGGMEAQGLSSTFDALVTAMLRPVEANRRHLVIAWTKPVDTISTTDATALRDVARRSDAVVHIVERSAELRAGTAVTAGFSPMLPFQVNLRETHVRTWRPFLRNDVTLLPEVAALTGGTFHPLGVLSDPNLAKEFKEIFEEFRSGYVLRYSPKGLSKEGWHDLQVTVPKASGADVRARRGYAIESATAPPSVQPRANATPLRPSIAEMRTSENPWPASPTREALLAVELVAGALSGGDSNARGAALDVIRRYADFVRSPIPGDAFECGWYGAVIASLEGALQTKVLDDLLARAVSRCPEDGRLQLARAFVSDQIAQVQNTALGGAHVDLTPAKADPILSKYDDAAKFAEVSREAHVRAAWLAYRVGRLDQARVYIDAVKPPGNDRALDYFGELVRAQILRAQGKADDAIGAFRAALATWPTAQSARVGLMMLLVNRGNRQEAESLAEAVQADSGMPIDPWWVYWQGDYRLLSVLHARLKELAE